MTPVMPPAQRKAALDALLQAIPQRELCAATRRHRDQVRRCGKVAGHTGPHRSAWLTWRTCDATAWHRRAIHHCEKPYGHTGRHIAGDLTWPNRRRKEAA